MYIDAVLRAETDAAGNYELSNMSTGKCRVVVSSVGNLLNAASMC